ncbi:MAG: SIR2 family NAD-dependent protein deacylase [Actinomycetota bacterium]
MAPHPDQLHIDQIRSALWRGAGRGNAALMVGAGMSLNAVPCLASVRRFPKWADLMEPIVARLYPGHTFDGDTIDRQHIRAGTVSSALRLAEEFATAFGENELEALLLKAIPDANYQPSALHERLLALQWADVFTTNWDTLLERCAETSLPGRYRVVRDAADLPLVQRPRIVKLHGTLGCTRPYILTETHFRTYPTLFAPFVNTVRQAIMENILCLVGFSGDDPNFLEWSGWVRDQLGDNAPLIYLASLDPVRSTQRAVLMRRRVVPIDLSLVFPAGTHDRAARSLEWFVINLEAGRPPDPRDWPHMTKSRPSMPPWMAAARFEIYDVDHEVVGGS